MIDTGVNILTRVVPSTPRSSNYPQGWAFAGSTSSAKARSSMDKELLSVINNKREEVIDALLEKGILKVDGNIRATGTIYGGERW